MLKMTIIWLATNFADFRLKQTLNKIYLLVRGEILKVQIGLCPVGLFLFSEVEMSGEMPSNVLRNASQSSFRGQKI